MTGQTACRSPGRGPLRIGLLGVGVVGAAVARELLDKNKDCFAGPGYQFDLKLAAVRDVSRRRQIPLGILSDDPMAVVLSDDTDIIIELMGGTHPAYACIAAALKSGKHVVTANKEVLAKHGDELHTLALENNVRLLYEASVGGGIPIIGPLSSDLIANNVTSVRAIINGTTNYVLSRMTSENVSFDEALMEAQSKGYAESDPTSDIDGFDAQFKIAILARLAFRTSVPLGSIYREGIRGVDARDIRYAKTLGFAVKLLAVARKEETGLLVRVHPALVPNEVPMAKVDGVLNVCEIQGDLVGPLWIQGRGAGADATASAVLGDLIRIARQPLGSDVNTSNQLDLNHLSMKQHRCQYYLRLVVVDRPGVLAQVAGILGRLNISIDSVIQMDSDVKKAQADIVLTTHPSGEADMYMAFDEIQKLEAVAEVARLLRIESYPDAV